MKLINFVLAASLMESSMAYTFYNTGAPDDAYWFDTKKKGSSPICDCEIFCSEKANCKYFVVGTTNCYLYSAAPSACW